MPSSLSSEVLGSLRWGWRGAGPQAFGANTKRIVKDLGLDFSLWGTLISLPQPVNTSAAQSLPVGIY